MRLLHFYDFTLHEELLPPILNLENKIYNWF